MFFRVASFVFVLTILTFVHCNVVPKLAEFMLKRVQNEKTKLKISCTPQEGSKPFHFEWHREGRLLVEPFHRFKISFDEDESELIIPRLSFEDSGNYSCTVRNDYGSDTQWTQIVVKGLLNRSNCIW